MSKKRTLTDEEKIKIAEAKEELKQYREEVLYIQEKSDDIEEINSILEKTTTRLSKTKISNNNMSTDKFSNNIDKLNSLEKEIPERLEKLLTMKFNIDEKIDKLKYPERDVLFLRYTRGKSWREITSSLKFESDRRTFQIHGDALLKYSKI